MLPVSRFPYRIGCSGWSYKSWVGPFYPRGTRPSDFLSLYSRVFDAVEIDSTFYSIPDRSAVAKWYASTPDNFIFTAKMPKTITHERQLSNCGVQLSYFLESVKMLREKLGCVLLQFPHSFSLERGKSRLASFIEDLPGDTKFALEFRDSSWFVDEVFTMLSDRNITLAWSDIPHTAPAERLTTGTAYLRLVGDRAIDERDFGQVRRDKGESISEWGRRLSARISELEEVFIFSNNHYQGFGPATANAFRKELGLDELDWRAVFDSTRDRGQSSLLDWGG